MKQYTIKARRKYLEDDYIFCALLNCLGNTVVGVILLQFGLIGILLFALLTYFVVIPSISLACVRARFIFTLNFTRSMMINIVPKIMWTFDMLNKKPRRLYERRITLLDQWVERLGTTYLNVELALNKCVDLKKETLMQIDGLLKNNAPILRDRKLFIDKR